MPRKPLLLGYDAAGDATLGPLLVQNPDWGHCLVNAGRGDPQPTDKELREMIDQASVLVMTFSSSPEGKVLELLACDIANELAVPIMLVGDTDQCFRREPQRSRLANVVAAVTVVSKGEIASARTLYPHAQVFHIFPPVWATYFTPLTLEERSTARSYLGVEDGDRVVFVSGIKNHLANLEVIKATVEAVEQLGQSTYRVVFAQHPGDKGEGEDTVAARLQVYRGVIANFPQHIIVASPPKDSGLNGDMLVKAANLVVVVSKASAARTAVAQRLPLIFVRTPMAKSHYLKEFGEGPNDFVNSLAAYEAEDAAHLADEIINLIDDGSGRRVVKQECFLPASVADSASVTALEAAVWEVAKKD